MELRAGELETPIGAVQWLATPAGICALGFGDWNRTRALVERRFGTLDISAEGAPGGAALEAYFAGDLRALDALPVDVAGTEFQEAVWTALRKIPVSDTSTYRILAAGLGRPTASRAVGGAVGSNPVSLILPCHRVLRADGGLSGFAWGVDRKRWLLAHEGALVLRPRHT